MHLMARTARRIWITAASKKTLRIDVDLKAQIGGQFELGDPGAQRVLQRRGFVNFDQQSHPVTPAYARNRGRGRPENPRADFAQGRVMPGHFTAHIKDRLNIG